MSDSVEREEDGADKHHIHRAEFPTPSLLSVKSERSRWTPTDFTNEPGPSHTKTKTPAQPTTDDDWKCCGCGFKNTAKDLRCRSGMFCNMTKSLATGLSWDSSAALPLSAADRKKDWHENISQIIRDCFVRSLVGDMMSSGDPAEDINLVTEVQNIERSIYESANSKDEYMLQVMMKRSELHMKRISKMAAAPGALPLSAADRRKDWHENISQNIRDHHVRWLVQNMSSGDPAEDIKDLVTEAQNIERSIYESANSWGEYKELAMKKRSELQMEKRPRDTSSSSSSSSRITGKLQIGYRLKKWLLGASGPPAASSSVSRGGQSTDLSDCSSGWTVEESSQKEKEKKEEGEISEESQKEKSLPRKTYKKKIYNPKACMKSDERMEEALEALKKALDSVVPDISFQDAPREVYRKYPSVVFSPSMPSSSDMSPPSVKRSKEADITESDIPLQDAPQEVYRKYTSDLVSPSMLSSSATSQHSPEEMSCDTAWDLSTTDQPVTESLRSVHYRPQWSSSELQDETDETEDLEQQWPTGPDGKTWHLGSRRQSKDDDETDLSDSGCRMEESVSLPRSHSLPSLSQTPGLENQTGFRAKRSHSVNDVTLLIKTQKITPDIIVEENEESYRFHCIQTGLFQCNVTDLGFKMETEGDVTYRTVPWNRRLLSRLDKRPAGPLFDIRCTQGSVCQLHLPHCEVLSTGGGMSLSVIHLMDDGIELIKPDVITETHVIINVNGFSPYGVITDANSTNPIRANVLLFYTPPSARDDSTLNVLLLPKTVPLRNVIDTRRALIGEEIYIAKPQCKLIPDKEYTLSASPQDDSITIEPDNATIDVDHSDENYVSTFEVSLERKCAHITLLLSETNASTSPWKRSIQLSGLALRREQVQRIVTLSPEDRLFSVRSSFIDKVSLPNLNSLLDKLFERSVLTDAEREMAAEMQSRREKAGFVIDTVRRKGPDASSSMILNLCSLDTFLSEHLGLM